MSSVTTERELVKGNEAVCEGAIRAGCCHYFGYPITPQNEVTEYMSARMPEVGGVFLQTESEVSTINMVYGASSAGARVMTSSSSPGISLMMEGISYLCTAELPCLILNVVRGGPGLGNIAPSQGDYFQACKGGGHGDYQLLVLAPNSVQEMASHAYLGLQLADKYRNPVMILADGIIGQMMEPVEYGSMPELTNPPKEWAVTGTNGRDPNIIMTIYLDPKDMGRFIEHLYAKYSLMHKEEIRYEELETEDCDVLVVAYGTVSRVVRSAVRRLRAKGLKVGLLRPITLNPFPYSKVNEIAESSKAVLVAEMSTGMMVEDVHLSLEGKRPIHFHPTLGGQVPVPEEIIEVLEQVNKDPQNPKTIHTYLKGGGIWLNR